MIRPAGLIERKRDGSELTAEEIRELVLGYASGHVPDYQMAAFLMAVYFRGLSEAETFALTDAMVASGETIALGRLLGRRAVDKHSTGGVGDKTSIAVGPIVAACGVPFGKMSGRGLGHTGGTLDKLEAIPGFRVELATAEFVAQVREIGIAIVGQSGDLVPADRLLYALRDVTATVENVSLIAASIMSKKLAAGADAIVLDVKVGGGAFMKTEAEARELAEAMIDLGRRAGRDIVCLLTDMDQPLGAAVGNALEVREAVATIRGEGPSDFTELVRAAATQLVALSDLEIAEEDARARVVDAVTSGRAFETYERWIHAQGGDPDAALAEAPVIRQVRASRDGWVTTLSALQIGLAALDLGAGRRTKDDCVAHDVGVVCLAKHGDAVTAGMPLAAVHARSDTDAEAAASAVEEAFAVGNTQPPSRPIVLDVVA